MAKLTSRRIWRFRAMGNEIAIVSPERIEQVILLIRGHKVMLDSDLAELYGVETRALVQAVKSGTSVVFPTTSCSNSPRKNTLF